MCALMTSGEGAEGGADLIVDILLPAVRSRVLEKLAHTGTVPAALYRLCSAS